jgi:hypothetical protein
MIFQLLGKQKLMPTTLIGGGCYILVNVFLETATEAQRHRVKARYIRNSLFFQEFSAKISLYLCGKLFLFTFPGSKRLRIFTKM